MTARNQSLIRYLSITVIVLLVAMLIRTRISPKPGHSKIGDTQVIIRNCYYNIASIEETSGESVRDMVRRATSATNLNTQLATLFKAMGSDAARLVDAQTDQILDAWNQPLFVRWRADLDKAAGSPELMIGTNDLLLWSVGPNGRNDFGYGDDVVFPHR